VIGSFFLSFHRETCTPPFSLIRVNDTVCGKHQANSEDTVLDTNAHPQRLHPTYSFPLCHLHVLAQGTLRLPEEKPELLRKPSVFSQQIISLSVSLVLE